MSQSPKDKNAQKGPSTTGHEWDGVQEYNNPLPRWWLWVFYATIIWSVGYWIVYPAWPTVAGYTKGTFGYASRLDVEKDLDDLKTLRQGSGQGIANTPVEAIVKDQNMLRFALAQGKAAFGDNCAPCHGMGATGGKGYPNLNDDEWIWGGAVTDIYTTLKHGIRHAADENTRVGVMTAFGKEGILKKDEIANVAAYVRTLSKLPPDSKADVKKGEQLFADNCAACHGDAGKGNQELGAPNLTDNIWLYGADTASLVETITNGRAGVMPAWSGRLDDVTIKSLAVYVHSLGGGK